MAKKKHLTLLQKGVDTWNQWRKNVPKHLPKWKVKPDLHRADLSELDLSGADLHSANLSGADLHAVNLSRANLSKANLLEADLKGANLNTVSLDGANLIKANLSGASLYRANLSGASLCRANLNGAVLNEADLSEASLFRVTFSGANLSEANLSGADLSEADLSGANLSEASLFRVTFSGANLSGANLSGANLSGANLSRANLSRANLNEAIFNGANLNEVNFNGANFNGADLSRLDLNGANLIGVKLSGTKLSGTKLSRANFSGAVLSRADLSRANLSRANFSRANLSRATLRVVQALGTNFTGATLTGACIEDWHINSATKLEEVVCEYVYLKANQQERRPSDPNRIFAPGEFTKLFQKALETVDLIFADGIDWKAFFQSFQGLQQQYADEELSIQAIERKSGGAFVIRLEIPAEMDKAAIEREAREKYEFAVRAIEAQYEVQLQLQGARLADFQERVEEQRQSNTNLTRIIQTMAEKPTYDLSNAKFGGGFAAEGGLQVGGTYNDFSQTIGNNLDEIQRLIAALRSQAEGFPEDKRDEAEVHLGDLENDIQQLEKRNPKRIKARLLALLAIASVFGSTVATGTDFANNVLELGKKFGLELVHPQSSQQAKPIDVKSIKPGQP